MAVAVLITVQLMQITIVFGEIVGSGILLARKPDRVPVLENLLYRLESRRAALAATPLLWWLAIGAGSSCYISLSFSPAMPDGRCKRSGVCRVKVFVSLWRDQYRALDAFFLLSLFVWLLKKIVRHQSPRAGAGVFWTANVVVALIYAAGHIPAAKSLMALTPIVWTAVLLPTWLAGLAFGYLAWKRGIEAAIVAHFPQIYHARLGP